jgi:transglutaminase-like putative cysteine protease
MPLPAESPPPAQRARASDVRQRLRALGLGHALTLAAALLTLLLATFAVPARAQTADAEGPPLREVTLPAGTFTRDTVLPAWVEPLPLPAVRAREPVLALLIDRQVRLQGAEVSVYAETAIQINETALLSLVGLMQVSFAPDHQRLVLHKAHLVRGSRTIDVTARAGVRFLQPRDEAPAQTYTGQVTAVLLLDDVRVGDVLVMAWRIDGNNPVFGEHLSFGMPWDAPLTTLQRRVRVLHPSAQPIHWRMLGDAGRPVPEPRSTSAGGWVDWRIEERDIAASALEPQVPDDWFEWRLLQISTWSDWPAVSRWAQALFAPDTNPLPEELEALLQRARALPDDDARVQLVLDWVQREIRYFALAVGESSHRPHAPALVLQRRWGDCKDKTQLLLTLLARLGIAAEPVLVSQQLPRAPAKSLPTPLAFDHVIARVRLGGDVLFLDATRAAQGVALRAQAQPPEWVLGLLADGRTPAPQPLVAAPPGRCWRSACTSTCAWPRWGPRRQ